MITLSRSQTALLWLEKPRRRWNFRSVKMWSLSENSPEILMNGSLMRLSCSHCRCCKGRRGVVAGPLLVRVTCLSSRVSLKTQSCSHSFRTRRPDRRTLLLGDNQLKILLRMLIIVQSIWLLVHHRHSTAANCGRALKRSRQKFFVRRVK